MKITHYLQRYTFTLLVLGCLFTGCNNDETAPAIGTSEDSITDVKLVFTNTQDTSDVVEARAKESLGERGKELFVLDEISLSRSTTYTLTYEMLNSKDILRPEDVIPEILEESHKQQFFFSFSDNAFTSPAGNGNIDNAADPINYNDRDSNGNNVGLSTFWTTSTTSLTGGTFTVRLQYQPNVKTATSGANDGQTDFNLEFVLNIQ